MTSNPFSIRAANPSDVPILANIFSDAFANDRVTQLKSLGKDSDFAANMISEPLKGWLQKPMRCQVLKAIDNATSEIIGWACWGFHGYEQQAAPAPEENSINDDKSKHEDEMNKAHCSQEGSSPRVHGSHDEQGQSSSEGVTNISAKTGAELLEAITDQDMEQWQKILMPEGTKCMFIVAIAVAPAHQFHGVGSALIRWGTAKADADEVSCWVHASEAGHRAFAKEGFREVGKLELDLDEFVPGALEEEGGEGKEEWGRYRFRYMQRLSHP